MRVWTGDETSAHIVEGGLQEAGFRTRVLASPGLRANGVIFGGRGSCTIAVRQRDLPSARSYLQDHGEASNLVAEEGGPSLTPGQRATLRFVAAAILVSVVVAIIVAVRSA